MCAMWLVRVQSRLCLSCSRNPCKHLLELFEATAEAFLEPICKKCWSHFLFEREREREVYSFSQISTSVSRASITTLTYDNEGYLDRNSNPNTTNPLPTIDIFDPSSARSQEYPQRHKTTWEKMLPQAPLNPSHTACRTALKTLTTENPVGKNGCLEKSLVPCEYLQVTNVNIVHPSMEHHSRTCPWP